MAESKGSSGLIWILVGVGCLGALVLVGVIVVFGAAGALFATRRSAAVEQAEEMRAREEEAQIQAQDRAQELAEEAEAARDEAEYARERALREQQGQPGTAPSADPLEGM